jgi:hypothetical protein
VFFVFRSKKPKSPLSFFLMSFSNTTPPPPPTSPSLCSYFRRFHETGGGTQLLSLTLSPHLDTNGR